MENRGCIRDGYKRNKNSDNESESSKAQVFFDNLIWGVDEVCSVSGYAKGTIYNLVSRGEIPYRTRGRRKRLVFVPSEIIAWLKGEQT
jgi:predicted DNA-binding transcriptional regulator AlpA